MEETNNLFIDIWITLGKLLIRSFLSSEDNLLTISLMLFLRACSTSENSHRRLPPRVCCIKDLFSLYLLFNCLMKGIVVNPNSFLKESLCCLIRTNFWLTSKPYADNVSSTRIRAFNQRFVSFSSVKIARENFYFYF